MGAGSPPRPSFTVRHKARREELDEAGVRTHFPSGQDPHGPVPPDQLASAIQSRAHELGFVRVGLAKLDPEKPLPGQDALDRWLARGFAGEMSSYLDPKDVPNRRADPTSLLPDARSLVVVALPHERWTEPKTPERGPGTAHAPLTEMLAQYARGADYHHALKDRLLYLADTLADLVGAPVVARTLVDTGPLLERSAAASAGLGFIGKNTMLIAPGQGSNVLLGVLVTSHDLLPEGARSEKKSLPVLGGCGTCRACLDACPTQAFADEYVLDARRCISYLTIELVGPIPRELRSKIGVRVFGCDVCQTVCPFNQTSRSKPSAPELLTRPLWKTRQLVDLLFLGSAQYRALIRGTALRRTFRIQLSRNAAVALGNTADPEAVAPLTQAAQSHSFELVQAHAAWALGELGLMHGIASARLALEGLSDSPCPAVRAEVAAWLDPQG